MEGKARRDAECRIGKERLECIIFPVAIGKIAATFFSIAGRSFLWQFPAIEVPDNLSVQVTSVHRAIRFYRAVIRAK